MSSQTLSDLMAVHCGLKTPDECCAETKLEVQVFGKRLELVIAEFCLAMFKMAKALQPAIEKAQEIMVNALVEAGK